MIPCENCLTLAICKNIMIEKIKYKPAIALMFLIDKCKLMHDYLELSPDDGGITRNYDKVDVLDNFFYGKV